MMGEHTHTHTHARMHIYVPLDRYTCFLSYNAFKAPKVLILAKVSLCRGGNICFNKIFKLGEDISSSYYLNDISSILNSRPCLGDTHPP